MLNIIKNNSTRFYKLDAAPSILLAVATVLAIIVANLSWSTQYFEILETKFFSMSVLHWVNDGLMAIFFFVVGLEIKKEVKVGELSTLKKMLLPVLAAVGGMLLPALIYLYFNQEYPQRQGWGIPMSTDIAFALGVLSLFNKRIPISLKIFLVAIAIVDDLGAILVIALFYTNNIAVTGLLVAACALGLILALRYKGVFNYLYYLPAGLLLWFGILKSGVHPTIAGVMLGLLTPVEFAAKSKIIFPIDELMHKLHPWVNFIIMPLFAFSNAGISFSNIDVVQLLNQTVSQGIFFGLVFGKPLGVVTFSLFFTKMGIAAMSANVTFKHILGAGCLAGIGFTMSLFISGLALPENLQMYSKITIVIASLTSAIVGAALLKTTKKI